MNYKRTIFVFGSNTQGRHGKGSALRAKLEHGAIYGQARGLQGNSYGIVTKELRPDYPSVTLEDIAEEVDEFIQFALEHDTWEFYVVQLGCGLAGFTPDQIAPLFINAPSNVVLSDRFDEIIQSLKPS